MPNNSPIDATPARRLKRVGVHTYGENVALISAHCVGYKPESFASLNKAEITAFLVASAAFMTTAEVLSLTTAMAAVGTRRARKAFLGKVAGALQRR